LQFELFHFTHDEIFLAFFSAALDLPNGRQAFVSFHQGKENKPAAGDKKR
jgi:hypothetical protein